MKQLSENVLTRAAVLPLTGEFLAAGQHHIPVAVRYCPIRLLCRYRTLVQSGPGTPSQPSTQVSPRGTSLPSRFGRIASSWSEAYAVNAKPTCRRFDRHATDRAFPFAELRADKSSAARISRTQMVTKSSTKENAAYSFVENLELQQRFG